MPVPMTTLSEVGGRSSLITNVTSRLNHPHLSNHFGLLRQSTKLCTFAQAVVLANFQGFTEVCDKNGNRLLLAPMEAVIIPGGTPISWGSVSQFGSSHSEVGAFTFGTISGLTPLSKEKCPTKQLSHTLANVVARGFWPGTQIAVGSEANPVQRVPFFTNSQNVWFNSDLFHPGFLLKIGTLNWGYDIEGKCEEAEVHNHGGNKRLSEMILTWGNMAVWYEDAPEEPSTRARAPNDKTPAPVGHWRAFTRRSIVLRGWHSWAFTNKCNCGKAKLSAQTRRWIGVDGSAQPSKMFFLYVDGGKASSAVQWAGQPVTKLRDSGFGD